MGAGGPPMGGGGGLPLPGGGGGPPPGMRPPPVGAPGQSLGRPPSLNPRAPTAKKPPKGGKQRVKSSPINRG
jgi:hypothetical protein